MKKILALMLVLVMLTLTACGGSSGAAMDMAAPESMKSEAPASSAENGLTSDSASMGNAPAENRKLIKTVNIEAETEELDPLLVTIDEKITALGGYAENREIYNGSAYAQRRYRRADMTIRIPADKVDQFVEQVSGISNIVSSNEYIEDVTLQYVDTESRVKALETEQARLLELLEQAQSMAELLEIEARLTDVRYELERVASRLRTLDNLVSYATVHLSLSEVQEYTPVAEKTVWQRISDGFSDSVEGLTEGIVDTFVWVIVSSPYLLLWGVILTAAILGFRKGKAKRAAKKQPKEEPKKE